MERVAQNRRIIAQNGPLPRNQPLNQPQTRINLATEYNEYL